jgi:hypothetical protein
MVSSGAFFLACEQHYRRSYGHTKRINVIWRAKDAVKSEHEGANRGDGVLFLPLDQRLLELKLKLKVMSDDSFSTI